MTFDLEQKKSVYRRRSNFELKREFDRPCVINIVKTNRLRYAGHSIRNPKGYFYSNTARNEVARKTEIQVGGWGEQRSLGPRLDAPRSGQKAMKRTSSADKLVVASDYLKIRKLNFCEIIQL
jgi:hypothetical protein